MSRTPPLAEINGDVCIGCTKCVAVCPEDCIDGARKEVHVVRAEACTGCAVCVPVCPVDCIDLIQDGIKMPRTRAPKKRESARGVTAKNLEERLPTEMQEKIAAARARAQKKYSKAD